MKTESLFCRRNQIVALAALAAFTMLVRGGALLVWGGNLARDTDAYLEIARNLSEGLGYSLGQPPHPTAFRPPLYPVVVAALFTMGAGGWAIGILHLALAVGTVLLTFKIGNRLGCANYSLYLSRGRLRYLPDLIPRANLSFLAAQSILAAVLVAVDPILLQYTAQAMTETVCTFLVALWLWLAVDDTGGTAAPSPPSHPGSRRTALNGVLTGAAFGLCALCRPTFLAFAGLALAWWIGQILWAGDGTCPAIAHRVLSPSRGRLRHLPYRPSRAYVSFLAVECLTALKRHGPVMIGTILVLLPWTIRNSIVIGKPIPTTTHGGYTLLLANNPVFYDQVIAKPWGTTWEGASLRDWQQELEARMSREVPPIQGEVARDAWMYSQAWKNIRAEPRLFLRACLWRIARFWDVVPRGPHVSRLPRPALWLIGAFYALVLGSALLGIWWIGRYAICQWLPLLGLLVAVGLVHTVYWTDMRMRAPLTPMIALLSAQGCRWLISVKQRRSE